MSIVVGRLGEGFNNAPAPGFNNTNPLVTSKSSPPPKGGGSGTLETAGTEVTSPNVLPSASIDFNQQAAPGFNNVPGAGFAPKRKGSLTAGITNINSRA